MKEISVIIVNWNSKDFLNRSLESIRENCSVRDCEVFVVDNNSSDGSADLVRKYFPQVKLIQNNENIGYAKANNQAIKESSGEYVLLLNPDTVLLPDAIEHLLSFMRENPDAGIVGPRLLNEDGTVQPSGKRFPSAPQTILETFFQVCPRFHELMRKEYERHLIFGRDDFEHVAETDEVSGACLLFRRQVIEEIGLLDDGFFLYYEDVDLCYRTKLAGWKVFILPEAQVVHHWGINAKERQILTITDHHKSRDLFFRKHHGAFAATMLKVCTVFLLLLDIAKNQLKGLFLKDLRDDLQRTLSLNRRIIRTLFSGMR
jgi:GT2 family glycosyltransferase